jgi:hypothetical protein
VTILEKWPKLLTTRELQQFTGFPNYYRKFIDGYGEITIPPYDSIKKKKLAMEKTEDHCM